MCSSADAEKRATEKIRIEVVVLAEAPTIEFSCLPFVSVKLLQDLVNVSKL